MIKELLEFHCDELSRCEDDLSGWANSEALCGDEKAKLEHIKAFQDLVSFHRRAVELLKAKQ